MKQNPAKAGTWQALKEHDDGFLHGNLERPAGKFNLTARKDGQKVIQFAVVPSGGSREEESAGQTETP